MSNCNARILDGPRKPRERALHIGAWNRQRQAHIPGASEASAGNGKDALLLQQPEYELASLDANGKQATFRKVTGARWLPDWRQEPFIVMNSVTK